MNHGKAQCRKAEQELAVEGWEDPRLEGDVQAGKVEGREDSRTGLIARSQRAGGRSESVRRTTLNRADLAMSHAQTRAPESSPGVGACWPGFAAGERPPRRARGRGAERSSPVLDQLGRRRFPRDCLRQP